jgi:hypothetical protein
MEFEKKNKKTDLSSVHTFQIPGVGLEILFLDTSIWGDLIWDESFCSKH